MNDILPLFGIKKARISRRSLLRASARSSIGAAAIVLVGCGENNKPSEELLKKDTLDPIDVDESRTQAIAGEEKEITTKPTIPDSSLVPKRGGTARIFAATDKHDRWDPHRSRFRVTQQFHSLMYNRLIRYNSLSKGILEGDLADLPEQPDELTYIFSLRPEARFWDREPTNGRPVTSEDIRFNIERQQDGLNENEDPDTTFYRQTTYTRTSSIEAQGERTIILKTETPDATYLGTVHAGPWAWITNREAVEEFGSAWRFSPDNAELNSGSGPYVPAGFSRGRNLALKRSSNWWKKKSGYLDNVIYAHAENSEIEQLYRDGLYDIADFPLGSAQIKKLREDFPNHGKHEFPIDTPIQFSYVLSEDPKNPLSDPRVGRALGIGIDRFELIERLYQGNGRPSGPVPWYMDGWTIPEDELVQFPGYRVNKDDELQELQALISAAGGIDTVGSIEIVVPDLFEGFFPGISATLRAMLERNTGINIRTRFASYEQIGEELQSGTLPSFFGWGQGPRGADPTDNWQLQAHSNGSGNKGRYSNTEIDELLDEMRITMQQSERQAIAKKIQIIMLETGYWIQNVTNGIQLGISQPFIHLPQNYHDFAWASHHLDSSWIDIESEEYKAITTGRTIPD